MENKRKIFFIAVLLVVLAIAGYVIAQARQPNQCCRIRATFTVDPADGFKLENKEGNAVGVTTLTDGAVVGAPATGEAGSGRTDPWCDLDRNGQPDGNIDLYSKDWGMICFLGTLNLIIKWLFIIIMLVVTIMIMYGGFLFVTAAGDPDRAGKGKKVLTYAAVGLAVALLARVIPSLLRFIIGV